LAQVLASKFSQLDPAHAKLYYANFANFTKKHDQVVTTISQLKAKYNHTPVTATEPVYGYMAEALGLKMHGNDFQWKIMNDTEPTPQMISNFTDLLTKHKVKVLFYNSQVSDPITKNMQELARQNKIAIVGVSETMPANLTINQWLLASLQATAKALNSAH
jgi:zinc/manganese transport system substrate-binding protein